MQNLNDYLETRLLGEAGFQSFLFLDEFQRGLFQDEGFLAQGGEADADFAHRPGTARLRGGIERSAQATRDVALTSGAYDTFHTPVNGLSMSLMSERRNVMTPLAAPHEMLN